MTEADSRPADEDRSADAGDRTPPRAAYRVAPGHALAGVLGGAQLREGDPVRARDLSGGANSLEALVAAGVVVKT